MKWLRFHWETLEYALALGALMVVALLVGKHL